MALPYRKNPLPLSFYARPTLDVARDMLGKIIVREAGEVILAARIVEVEAYLGALDAASHAYRGNKGRATLMFGRPGHLYVYFSYGMHFCMNAVAHDGRHAGAVLMRAAEPVLGIEQMAANRKLPVSNRPLAKGPACLTSALGIGRAENGLDLTASGAVALHESTRGNPFTLGTSVRIGITQAAERPWRFFVCGNENVSGPGRLNRC